ncbi:pyridine nucleotide-disulfide oxidoreductase domain-containing protein 1 [Scaptodrosophila lebanonensis]|uniref:Pyridine nucleotide-disulfide oxidoreductase domain-containing protein 1 n=1 Tax=Drosophila lebanonensis TaxID=7225 RepID=A0A6J2TPF2_DROLE|nr:pyridine nucleotide-disulfide oxidoreductase domain-containing protein 1 [Scaptodrosophila lebanonensis]
MTETTFLVVGGGIAGVTCAETLAICCPAASILLVTESSIVKTVTNLVPIARYLHQFDVREKCVDDMSSGIGTIVDQLLEVNATQHWVRTKGGKKITYRYLCLCTGGAPRLFAGEQVQKYERVVGIRDTDSVLQLQRLLGNAKDVLILGNGGIASELAYELHDVNVHWVIKDNHISATFVDPGAAEFFQISQQGKEEAAAKPAPSTVLKRMRYSEMVPTEQEQQKKRGAALGPDWHRSYDLCGQAGGEHRLPKIYYKSYIDRHELLENGLRVTLRYEDGRMEQINCDFLVSATGVEPRHDFATDLPLTLAADGGIAVDEMMRTNLTDVYAAGDVCSANWPPAEHWFQMRLWTQARQMGGMAGRSMAAAFEGETIYQDFCFELFGHVTQLFGFPVVLMGRFNGQGLGRDYELLLRCTPNKEYIKFVLQNGRLRGAILIGDTDLAETCENLILNAIDLSPFENILDPNIDIEDYFD